MTPEELFLTLLNRSLAAVWLVLAILLLRPFLKKVSRAFCCAMWGLVAIRLLCPFSVRSVLSLIPDAQPIPTDLAAQSAANGSAGTGVQAVTGNFTSFLPSVTTQEAVNPVQTFTRVAAVLWMVGMALIALYALVSYLHLRSLVREAVRHPDGYWLCDRIETPFVLGLFRPRIFLPLWMDAGDIPYVMAHERAHLARRDHWRKPIAFALLTVFWFQPVLWVAYFLLRRDVEFACDERAIRKLGVDLESRKSYAKALLRGSSPRAYVRKLSCPLAFGGLQVKRRVKSVMTYKRPAVTLLLAALLVFAAVAVCFLTDPSSSVIAIEIPKENTDAGGTANPETPVTPSGGTTVGTAGSGEKAPAEEGSEERELEAWLASLPASWNATKEEFMFAFILSRLYEYGEEDGAVYVFKNVGTKTVTLTLAEQYWRYTPTPEAVEAMMKDPGVSAPYAMYTAQIITVEIPVGETVRLRMDPELLATSVYGVYGNVSATYGSLSASME